MTAVLDQHPHTGHPVLEDVVALDALIDRLLLDLRSPLPPDLHASALSSLERVARRLESMKLMLVAAADRAGTARQAGFSGTDAWAARHTHTTRAAAAREVHLAHALESGHEVTAAALHEGLLSAAHASVILAADRRLPATVTPAQRATVENRLVAHAQHSDPDQLRRVARRALAMVESDAAAADAHEDGLVRAEEQAAYDATALSLHDNGDGTVTGRFTVPTLAAAVLRKVIDSMTAPRRLRGDDGRGDDERAGEQRGGDDHGSDWRHRRGLAFAELLEHLPTDHLHTRTAATVVVTVDESVLRGALRTAGLDTGDTISSGEARRLACGAGIIPAVLGGASVALDLGREHRLFSASQRLALGLTHETCAADGCDRPFAWCELHHRKPWSRGGRTDLADAVPLCHFHHQRIHDPGYDHRRLPDGSIRFSRRP